MLRNVLRWIIQSFLPIYWLSIIERKLWRERELELYYNCLKTRKITHKSIIDINSWQFSEIPLVYQVGCHDRNRAANHNKLPEVVANCSDVPEMYYCAVLVLFSPILELYVPVLLGVAAIEWENSWHDLFLITKLNSNTHTQYKY